MPQSRSRVYFILCKCELASKEKLVQVFHTVLKERLLPLFKFHGRATVAQCRDYVSKVLEAMEWRPTFPVPSQDPNC